MIYLTKRRLNILVEILIRRLARSPAQGSPSYSEGDSTVIAYGNLALCHGARELGPSNEDALELGASETARLLAPFSGRD